MATMISTIILAVFGVLKCAVLLNFEGEFQFASFLIKSIDIKAWAISLFFLAVFIAIINLIRLPAPSTPLPLSRCLPRFCVPHYRSLAADAVLALGLYWLSDRCLVHALDRHHTFNPLIPFVYSTACLLFTLARTYARSNSLRRLKVCFFAFMTPCARTLLYLEIGWFGGRPILAVSGRLVLLSLVLLVAHSRSAFSSTKQGAAPFDKVKKGNMDATPGENVENGALCESGKEVALDQATNKRAAVRIKRPLRMPKDRWLRTQRQCHMNLESFDSIEDPIPSLEGAVESARTPKLPLGLSMPSPSPSQSLPSSLPTSPSSPPTQFPTPSHRSSPPVTSPKNPTIFPATPELPQSNLRLPGSFEPSSDDEGNGADTSPGVPGENKNKKSGEMVDNENASGHGDGSGEAGDIGESMGECDVVLGGPVDGQEQYKVRDTAANLVLPETVPGVKSPGYGTHATERGQPPVTGEPAAENGAPLSGPTLLTLAPANSQRSTADEPGSPSTPSTPSVGAPVAVPEPPTYHLNAPVTTTSSPAGSTQAQETNPNLNLEIPIQASPNASGSAPYVSPSPLNDQIASSTAALYVPVIPQPPSPPPTPEVVPMEITETGAGLATSAWVPPVPNRARFTGGTTHPSTYPQHIVAMLESLAHWFRKAAEGALALASGAEMDIDQAEEGDAATVDAMDIENGMDTENDMGMEEVEALDEVDEVEMEEPGPQDAPMASPALTAIGLYDTPMGSPSMESNWDDDEDMGFPTEFPTAMELSSGGPTQVPPPPQEIAQASTSPPTTAPIPAPLVPILNAAPASTPVSTAAPRHAPHYKNIRQGSKMDHSRLPYWTRARPSKPSKRCANRAPTAPNPDQSVPPLWLDSICRATFPEWETTGFVPQLEIPHIPQSWMAQPLGSAVGDLVSNLQQVSTEEAPPAASPSGHSGEAGWVQTEQNMDQLAQMFDSAIGITQAEIHHGEASNEAAGLLTAQQEPNGPETNHELEDEGEQEDGPDEGGNDVGMDVELEGGDDAAAEEYLNNLLPELLGAGPA